jgi:hypothetical protein
MKVLDIAVVVAVMLEALGLAWSVRVVEQYQLSAVAYFPARPRQRSR